MRVIRINTLTQCIIFMTFMTFMVKQAVLCAFVCVVKVPAQPVKFIAKWY